MSKNDLWIEDFCLCTNQGQAVTAESLAHTLRELRYGPVAIGSSPPLPPGLVFLGQGFVGGG